MLLSVVLSVPTPADTATNAGTCYTINDPDYRALCRAKVHREPSICYSIQRQDVRGQCLAETHQ